MPPLPRYLCSDYITYREPVVSKPSHTNNDCFDHKDRSIQKKKHKVIKQVYRVKKDRRFSKNSDLIQDKEKPIIESLTSYIDQIAPDVELISNDIAKQRSNLARGKARKRRLATRRPV